MVGDESERERAELIERTRKSPEMVSVDDAIPLLSACDADEQGNVVGAIAAVVEAHPDDTSDTVSSLRSSLTDEDASVRSAAATTVGYVASERPSLVAETIPVLVERLNDPEPLPRINATQALSELAIHRPAAVATGISTLSSLLESDFPNLRIHSAQCIATVARESPEEVTPILPDLFARALDPSRIDEGLSSGPDGVNRNDSARASPMIDHARRALDHEMQVLTLAAKAIGSVARQRPEAISYDRRYVTALETDASPAVERAVVAALGAVAQTTPERAHSAIDPLARLLEGDYASAVQGDAAMALAHLADEYFERVTSAVEPAVPTLRSLLEADDPHIRGGAVGLLTYLGERFSETVAPAVPTLCSLLSDDYGFVRAQTAFALGFVGDIDTLGALAEVKTDDPSPEARAAASEAIRRIRWRETDDRNT